MKICTRCKTAKPLDDFYRNCKAADGRASHCVACAKTVASMRPIEQRRKYTLKNKFGLTMERYQAMLSSQNGLCAICARPETAPRQFTLGVDHDHATGMVRGLLCSYCNRAIGLMKDNPDFLERAADYLRRNSTRKAA